MQSLQENTSDVDFAHYRSVLTNKGVIDEIENAMKTHKVKTYDVARQLKAIETFEAQAVRNAEETAKTVETELRDLQKTLDNIKAARSFADCTTVSLASSSRRSMNEKLTYTQDEVMAAEPELDKKVENMVKNHRWMPPGYKVRETLSLKTRVTHSLTDICCRRNLATCLSSRGTVRA